MNKLKMIVLLAMLCVSNLAHAEVRLEIGVGTAKHGLAEEGSWWYEGFQVDTKLKTSAFSVGILWTPIEMGKTRLGARIGYSDLGRITANNTFPIYEDWSSSDARVNPNCDRTTLAGCTGKYQGAGKAKGLYVGPVVERDFETGKLWLEPGKITLGLEGGLFFYRSEWVAINARAVDQHGEFVPAGWDQIRWDHVRNDHGTWYVGLNARWNDLFVSWRRYSNVRASDTSKGFEYVGISSGPVWSVTIGASLKF
jgi:hypothetical protein